VRRVLTVLGTRPEIIRLSRTLPLLDQTFEHTLVHTGQNWDYELGQIFFDQLALRTPDIYLDIDTSSLGSVLGGILASIEPVLLDVRPEALLVLGDTNSSLAAIMAKRMQIPVYHMEAGNRSFDPNVPEEVNRRIIDHVADFNLVYTEHARRNLLAEGLPAARIAVTGSPLPEVLTHYAGAVEESRALDELGLQAGGYVLVSMHREENVDEPHRLAALLDTLVGLRRELGREVVVSTHPRTRIRLEQRGGTNVGDGIRFAKPFGFLDWVRLQKDALCVVSDSGTISEESAFLGFPAITIRDAIERPEAVEAGSIVCTGVQPDEVLGSVQTVLAQADRVERSVPAEYSILDFSHRVVSFVLSTVHSFHERAALRKRAPVWGER
jgi:UDP-N-acetyl-L-fucosamine synthase